MGRYRRYLIGLAVVLVLIGAYAAAGFWAVPHFARSSLQKFVATHYGRTLSIGEIRFNPFTLKLDVSQVSLPDADGKTMLAFEHLHVDLQLATLWRLGPSFREILLEKPYVRAVIRPDGALNLGDLGKGFPEEPQKPQQKSKPLRLYIGRLAVISGSSTFEDRTRPTAFHAEFNPIAFELRDFGTVGDNGNAYTLTAASPQGGRLNWNGTLQLAPLSSRGVFEIAELHARTVWNYVHEIAPFEINSGEIDIKGDYDLATGGGPLALKFAVHNSTVTNLGLRPKSAAQNYVDLARIEVDDTRIDVTKHSVDVAKVKLSGGDLKVWMDEQGRLNLLDLTATASAPVAQYPPPVDSASPAAPTPPPHAHTSGGDSANWTVSAPDIAIEGLKVSAEDRQVKPALALAVDPLNIHVAGFNTAPDDTLDITVDSTVNGSGKLSVEAKVTPKTGNLTAHVEAAALGLPVLQPYISRYTSMTLLNGTLGARIDLERHPDGYLEVKGNTQVAGIKTVDNSQKRDFITWKDLKVADLRYRSKPQSLRVGSVTAIEPYARVIIRPDRTVNIGEVLMPAGTAPERAAAAADLVAEAPPPAPKRVAASRQSAHSAPLTSSAQTASTAPSSGTPFPVSIGTVRFINAAVDYTDLWIKPSFAVGIQTLNGTVTGLSSAPKSRAKVQLDGKVDRYSPAHIGGEANILSAALYTDITMSFKDIDLTIVNPYSGHFMGYKIDKGKLSFDVSYQIEQRKLNAKQHFVVDQLELGERVESPDAVHLPLKLAVALLKDRNGVIDLDLPMTGMLDDPHFRIGPIIWKMFLNLIVKAATAPFALLGHLFGGGEHMNIVEFPAGSAELEKPAKEQLAALAKSLKERPQLKLDVPIVYSKGIDRPQLAAAQLREKLLARVQNTRHGKKHPDTAGEEAFGDPEKHFHLLLDQFKEDLGKNAPLPESAQAVQAAKRKETPPYEPAIADLNVALINHIEVPDADLVALGKDRARAIQDVLLSEGQIEPARVFIVDAPPKPDSGDKVKVEMAVK